MNVTFRAAIVAAALHALGADAAHAATAPTRPFDARSTERTLEASTSGMSLPTTVPGPLLVQGCPSCPRQQLHLTPATAYRVGPDAVSFTELVSFVRSGGPYFATIHYALDAPMVTRIVVAGRLQAASKR